MVMPGQQDRLSHLHDVEDILAHGAGQRLERDRVLVAVRAEVLDQEAGAVLLVPLVTDGAGVLLAAQGLLAKGAGAALQARDHGQAAVARPTVACRGNGDGLMRLWWPTNANVAEQELQSHCIKTAILTLPHRAGGQGQPAADASPCLSAGPLAILGHPGGRKGGPCIDLSRAEAPQSLSAAHCERHRMVLMVRYALRKLAAQPRPAWSTFNALTSTAPPPFGGGQSH